MKEESRNHDINEPVFAQSKSGLMVSFRANLDHIPELTKDDSLGEKLGDHIGDHIGESIGDRVGEKVGDRVGEKLTENQRMIVRLLNENPRMAGPEIAEKVGISKRKMETNIARLKTMKKLQRIGSARGGYWEVLDE